MAKGALLRVLVLSLVVLSASTTLAFASTVTVQSTNDQVSVTLTILDAFYTDADGDGYEDDVVGYFDIHLYGRPRYTLDIYPSLVLPSGTTHTYLYTINTRLDTLHCTMYFYDHALESGNYTFAVEIVLYTGGVTAGEANYLFDPPGGSGDADPCGFLVVSA